METDRRFFACSHDGYHPGNRANWCDGGCGRDYNRMIDITEAVRAAASSSESDTTVTIDKAARVAMEASQWVRAQTLAAIAATRVLQESLSASDDMKVGMSLALDFMRSDFLARIGEARAVRAT